MQVATTETHTIEIQGDELVLIDCESHIILEKTPISREGILALIEKILNRETELPNVDEMALTISSALWDQEFQRRESRDGLLQSLCAQIEIFQGKTPFPEP